MSRFVVMHRADSNEEIIVNLDQVVRVVRVRPAEDPLKITPEEARCHLLFVNPEYSLFVRETFPIVRALIGRDLISSYLSEE